MIAARCTEGVEKSSKLKKLQGIMNNRKRDTDGTIILFLISWYFIVKYQGIKEQYYCPVCVSSVVSFFFRLFLIPCNFLE